MNMQLGYAPLRDRRVSIRAQLIALGIGAAAVGAIELLQLPVEGVVAALLPFIGAAGDLALDGAEAVIGPVLIATLVLPHIAPADIVRQIRAERARGSCSLNFALAAKAVSRIPLPVSFESLMIKCQTLKSSIEA